MGFIQTEEGILNQIKQDYYFTGILTKEGVYNYWIDLMEDFYKKYPYAVKWNYEKFIKEMLDYETV